MLLWLGAYICNWLGIWVSGYIAMSGRRIPTSFPQWPSHPLWCLLCKKANHFTMTTLNIRSDPMATWECAKQVQASPQLLGKHNACALHFRELKKNSHQSTRCTSERPIRSLSCMQLLKVGQNAEKFQVGIILPDSQDPRILEICKKVKGIEGPATGRFIRGCVSLLSGGCLAS